MKFATYIKNNYLLLLILLLAAALRIYHISFQSPWLDEIHTLNEANPSNSFFGIYDKLLDSEPHPPLYFYVIHICFHIFGYTIETARLFSVVCGVAGVYAVYLLAKEVLTKRAGIFAALLLSVNAFHIQYSQDGRMYTFFFLFTTLALYSFIRFIKSPTWVNTIYYSVFSALMIYGHFFGLLGLFAQYITLLIFIATGMRFRKELFIKSLVAGIVTLIFYLPAIRLFIKSASLENIWIPPPEPGVYIDLFKALVGNTAILTSTFSVLIVLSLLNHIWVKKKTGNTKDDNEVIKGNTEVLIIQLVWISVILIIPLVKSYISLPVIVERYFINILPVILIMTISGLFIIKSTVIRNVLISLIAIISLYNLIYIKEYYSTPAKAQFREVTQFIKNNNKDNTQVVSALAWYLPYFLKNDSVNYNITSNSLNDYIKRLSRDTTRLKPFWYVDGHHRPYSVTPDGKAFLEKYYYVENNIDAFGAWAKHYILKKDAPRTIDVTLFKNIKENNGDPILFQIDNFKFSHNIVRTSGWAFLQNVNSEDSVLYIVALKDKEATILPSEKVIKTGINEYFKLSYNATNSGFVVDAPVTNLEAGTYKIGIFIKNILSDKQGLVLTDKTIEVN